MSHVKAYGVVVYKVLKNDVKILLCKATSSKNKWGCLKGGLENNETSEECARREFLEESSLETSIDFFEEYFEQKNTEKDVGVWLVKSNKIKHLEDYFSADRLKIKNLSWENSEVKFFSLRELPLIKKKQVKLVKKIKDFLQNKHLSH